MYKYLYFYENEVNLENIFSDIRFFFSQSQFYTILSQLDPAYCNIFLYQGLFFTYVT